MPISFADLDAITDFAKKNYADYIPKPEELTRYQDTLVKGITQHPLFKQYMRHLDLGHQGFTPRNTQPWTAVGEQLYARSLLAHMGKPGSAVSLYPTLGLPSGCSSEAMYGLSLAMRAGLAVPYLWSDRVQTLIRQAPMPRHVISRALLPYPIMFLSRETALRCLEGETREYMNLDNNWVCIQDTGDFLSVVEDMSDPKGRFVFINTYAIEYGSRFPEDYEDKPWKEMIGELLKKLAFLNSPYVATEQHHLPRQFRKEMSRKNLEGEQLDPLIHTVTLRREAAAAVQKEQEDREAGRQWQHHWWVSGHNRAQWYPSEQAHKVIWVAPYLKGPTDKPLLEKVYTVVR